MPTIKRNGRRVDVPVGDPALAGEPAAVRAAREAAAAAVRHRRLRALAYRDEMGAEKGDFVITVGDVLDAVLGQCAADKAAGREMTLEMDTLLAKRADIKRRFPKPDA